MYNRKNFDLSKYFIVGPENTLGRDVVQILKDVIEAGFTFIQLRSKTASARQMIELCVKTSDLIKELNKEDEVSLVVDDRLDVILAAREEGAKVDGIHVGQKDIPVEVCRKYLGEDSIVGLSARTEDLIEYVKVKDTSNIDYFGAGPLRPSTSKPDCGMDESGNVITRSFKDIKELKEASDIPVVIGGGVKIFDLNELASTGVDGFFLISAISEADNPKMEAEKISQKWDQCIKENK
ncbi:thiamine phosphate synthase [uncultured Anaerococcus sp.]|uniref:thiamine phosphate synthase n=1 Tax=uncultured Anaerococcus sp. TaxID=293428 RepID=UPI002611FD9E|nr:thiamine phosphate synthase [uncultured Anaerococcus sp.]